MDLERINFPQMNAEELLETYSAMQAELDKFDMDYMPLPSGDYTVGVDIRGGRWEILMLCKIACKSRCVVYSDTSKTRRISEYETVVHDYALYSVTLQEGMVLAMEAGNCTHCYIRKAPMIGFAP